MSTAIVVQAFLHFVKLNFIGVLANHLVNIPLSLFIGLGKYVAFCIALVMDCVQLVIFYSVLNHTKLARKFNWHLDKKLVEGYKKPSFFVRMPRPWAYMGVSFLSLLPIYFGGLFAAVFTAHLLKLNRRKSLTVIGIGSVIGCFIWTVGVWTMVGSVISLFES